MAKAKLVNNRRQTRSPRKRTFRKREDGRPKGTHKRYLFEETRLGFMLKYEAPVVFELIMRMTPKEMNGEPPLLLVKTVCRSSNDPSLRKKKFFRYLEEYTRLGLYCKRPKVLTEKRKGYYEGIRRKKLEKYIQNNKGIISVMMDNNKNIKSV